VADGFYESRSLNVEVYAERSAEWNEGILAGDSEFYVDLARQCGTSVLDVGCGQGRTLLPLVRAGFYVTGLDLSEPMLEFAARCLAQEREDVRDRGRLLHADMRDFDAGRQFDLAIIAFRSFQMLLTPEDEQACLDAIHRHLRPGGTLVVTLFDPLHHLLLPGNVGVGAGTRTVRHPATGNEVHIEVLDRTNDPVRQVYEERWRFSELAADGSLLRSEEEMLRMRWIYRMEMQYLLERQGFEVVAEYSDYRRSPRAYGKEQIWVARAV
jgi:SAM-dependent methyltransferase